MQNKAVKFMVTNPSRPRLFCTAADIWSRGLTPQGHGCLLRAALSRFQMRRKRRIKIRKALALEGVGVKR